MHLHRYTKQHPALGFRDLCMFCSRVVHTQDVTFKKTSIEVSWLQCKYAAQPCVQAVLVSRRLKSKMCQHQDMTPHKIQPRPHEAVVTSSH